MITYLTSGQRPQLAGLWKTCFVDTDEFVRFYFDEVLKEEQTLVLNEGGRLIASLQMIPYTIQIGAVSHSSAYIYAVMTHPDHRGKGLMARLMDFAFDEMRKKGYDYAFLLPEEKSLFDLYARFGFERAFPRRETVCCRLDEKFDFSRRTACSSSFLSLEEAIAARLFPLYHSLLSRIPNVVLKTPEQFHAGICDIYLDGGSVYARPEGIAFVLPDSQGWVAVKELLAENEDAFTALMLDIMADHPSSKGVVIENNPGSPAVDQKGMILPLKEGLPLPTDIYLNLMLS